MSNLIGDKSFAFAVRIYMAVKFIKEEKREFELANQLLRSGTSIGANISEGKYAQSDRDFVSKHKIALKEANETMYWLRLIKAVGVLNEKVAGSLMRDADELMRILSSIIISKENNMNQV